jgi:hypothetical protein
MKFTIRLSDAQRLVLLNALNAEFAGLIPDVESEASILFDMLRDLPECESADPGILHDFTV